MRNSIQISLLALVAPFLTHCGGESSSFSLLADSDTFQQSSALNDKVDILWVIDNSGSMQTSQENLVNNMNSFIADFESKNLDFKMAVTATDAFRILLANSDTCALFRQGPVRYNYNNATCQYSSPANSYPVVTPGTPDMLNTFLYNVLQGVDGLGDERPLQSLQIALDHPGNANFVREGSFLSVIILTDEDDFSHDGNQMLQGFTTYDDPRLHTIQSYVDYLDGITSSAPSNRRYNVNGIAIYDEACRQSLNNSFSGRMIAQRVGELVDATGGLKTSLCGNFADDLKNIADNILTLATEFRLSRIPKPETIGVTVNGVGVPNRNSNPQNDGGWEYDATNNSIKFYGSNYFPAAGSSIRVDFDPVQYGG